MSKLTNNEKDVLFTIILRFINCMHLNHFYYFGFDSPLDFNLLLREKSIKIDNENISLVNQIICLYAIENNRTLIDLIIKKIRIKI